MIRKILLAWSIIFIFTAIVSSALETGGTYMKLEKLLEENKVDSVIVGRINGIEIQEVKSIQKEEGAKGNGNHFNDKSGKRLILKVNVMDNIAGNYPSGNLTVIYTEPANANTSKSLPDEKKEAIMHPTLAPLWTGSGDEFKVAINDKRILFLGKSNDNYTLLRIEPFTEELIKYTRSNGPLSDFVTDFRGVHDFEFQIHENLKPHTFRLHGNKVSNTIEKIEIFLEGQKIPFQEIHNESWWLLSQSEKYFEVIDMNFDGYKDIKLLDWHGGTGNGGYKVWLYEPSKKEFILHEEFRDLSNPICNDADQTISTHFNGGHAGRIYGDGLWMFKNGKIIRLELELQDYVMEKNHYIKVKSKLIDGKMQEISREIIKMEF